MDCKRDIDEIIERIKQRFPQAIIEQSRVAHPADDDGIWYFWLPEFNNDDVQIENSLGECPFLIENRRDDKRRFGNTIDEVVAIISEHFITAQSLNK